MTIECYQPECPWHSVHTDPDDGPFCYEPECHEPERHAPLPGSDEEESE